MEIILLASRKDGVYIDELARHFTFIARKTPVSIKFLEEYDFIENNAVVVCVLSADFFNTITSKIEQDLALKRLIVPVLLFACNWRDSEFFCHMLVLPRNKDFIAMYGKARRDHEYAAIANEIRKVILEIK